MMMNTYQYNNSTMAYLESRAPGARQAGGLTIYSAIFVLVLMTLMSLYATRVTLYEQRISANEARQKLAFHAAESATAQVEEYVLANVPRLFEFNSEAMSDGAGGYRAGWFANDGVTPGWSLCLDEMVASDSHPCGGELNADDVFPGGQRPYFYDDPATDTGTDSVPFDRSLLPANTMANASMLLCIIDRADPAGGCVAPPSTADEIAAASGIILLISYGWSDCEDVTDIDSCNASAFIARPVGNFKLLTGPPGMPLTTKSTFPPTGTAEVVVNPNAGGVGVPGAVWANDNGSCDGSPVDVGEGSWATCHMHEWYGKSSIPTGVACDAVTCECTEEEALSYSVGETPYMNVDIVPDAEFPCDLFEHYFGIPRADFEVVKDTATVHSDCSAIDQNDSGLFWISGASCEIGGDRKLGTPENPIVLVSAAGWTTIKGSAEIYGIFYVFDGEDPAAVLDAAGGTSVYGAVVVDAALGDFTGDFQVVYNGDILARAAGTAGFGKLPAGWRDFGPSKWGGG